MDDVKQVIVVRKDLKMRRGKEIAQCCHASTSVLIQKILHGAYLSEEEVFWISGHRKKVCLQVNSEEELLDIHQKALDAGLFSNIVTDMGLTEFNGVPTKTCLAIGPDTSEKIDKVTGGLKLY